MRSPCESDREVLAALEGGIPIEPRPFESLGRSTGLSEDAFLARTRALLDSGAVKRLAVVFDSRKVGHSTTLVAARAAEGEEPQAVDLLGTYEEVTHNYLRDGSGLDIWFTLVAESRSRIEEILDRLQGSGLFEELVELPSVRKFKVDVRFSAIAEGGENV